MKIFNLLLVMIIANLSFADDHGNPSSAAGAGLPEGGFSTFHVVAENPYEYIEVLKATPEALAAGGGDVVGYCMTMTGHDYPGEMFIWNAYSSLKDALSSSAGLSYNPYDAPKQLQNISNTTSKLNQQSTNKHQQQQSKIISDFGSFFTSKMKPN